MSISNLNLADSMGILREGKLGMLGCIAAGEPYVVPVNYYFDGQDLYLHSLPGKKIQALRVNPRVCFQVCEIQSPYHWRSVIAYGNYEEISGEQEREVALARLYRSLPHLSPVESKQIKDPREIIVFRIKVDEITGLGEDW
ncbi:MAG TPA: pyridoxamine 5'-phosphate oxidase family protein [Blastocatellia bacterium]|nr:pyridoxamine 5'-phosphate oxidase family protein [Blastocatellia bacterium]